MRWGVEQEHRVWCADRQLDFRALVGLTGLPALDPGDPRARRLPSGAALTADGWEAELSTPPLPVAAGPVAVDHLLRTERDALCEFVRAHGADRVEEFSTHLNVSVPDDRVVDVGRAFLPLVPALAHLVEPPTSSGVLVRPRRHRLELGGEYAEGARLRAGLTFLACATTALLGGRAVPDPPPAWEPSREKFGWFVPPAELTATVGDASRAWDWCRDLAEALGIAPDPVDQLLDGVEDEPQPPPDPLAEVRDRGPRTTPAGLRAATEWLTWAHAVWRVSDGQGRRAVVVVPADDEGSFLGRLDAGLLDDELRRFLRRRRRTVLLVNRDLGDGGWWHDLRPAALVPAERGPDGRVPHVDRRAARADHRRSAG